MDASGLGSSSGSRAQAVVAGCAAGSAGEGARAERMAASEGLQEGTQAVVTNPGGVATASPGPRTQEQEMAPLENEMQHTLGLMTDALRVQLPFTVEDKKRIVRNLNNINLEWQELTDEPSMVGHTRAVLSYMLKELDDVFVTKEEYALVEDSKAAATHAEVRDLNRTQEANADEEGLAGRKRQRSLPATALPATG